MDTGEVNLGGAVVAVLSTGGIMAMDHLDGPQPLVIVESGNTRRGCSVV